MKKKKNYGAIKSTVAVGVALAAAAGAYFLYGTKEGRKQKKKIQGWAVKAKGEVLEKLEGMKDVNEATYKQVVASVLSKYKKLKKDHSKEIDAVSKELVGHWKNLKKTLKNLKTGKK